MKASVAHFGVERRTLAETFLALVGRPVDEPDGLEPAGVGAATTGEAAS